MDATVLAVPECGEVAERERARKQLPQANSSAAVADSIWQHKPWWCQPWSILLSGVCGVGASWWLGQRLWLSLTAGVLVLVWWLLFLVLVPAAWAEQQRAGGDQEDL